LADSGATESPPTRPRRCSERHQRQRPGQRPRPPKPAGAGARRSRSGTGSPSTRTLTPPVVKSIPFHDGALPRHSRPSSWRCWLSLRHRRPQRLCNPRPARAPVPAAPIAAVPTGDGCGAADGSGVLAGSDANLAINRWADVSDTFMTDGRRPVLRRDREDPAPRRVLHDVVDRKLDVAGQFQPCVLCEPNSAWLNILGTDVDRVAAAVGPGVGDGGPLLAAGPLVGG
jgi:hypothetical protein